MKAQSLFEYDDYLLVITTSAFLPATASVNPAMGDYAAGVPSDLLDVLAAMDSFRGFRYSANPHSK
jgi:hypothetical protein